MKKVLIIGSAGYVGSLLMERLKGKHILWGLDPAYKDWVADNPTFLCPMKYQELLANPPDAKFDAVVFLVGYSTVKQCRDDPVGSWKANVGDFGEWLLQLPANVHLIYASSIAVYGDCGGMLCTERMASLFPAELYDLHKHLAEQLIKKVKFNSTVLRLGAVCGVSPHMRDEVVLNSMVKSAVQEGVVRVANTKTNRPILWLETLATAVERVIDRNLYGTYNLATHNYTFGELASIVSHHFKCPVESMHSHTPYNCRASVVEARKDFLIEGDVAIQEVISALEAHYAKTRCLPSVRAR
jgi:nucleoside-diphosphate-sugar epimerase